MNTEKLIEVAEWLEAGAPHRTTKSGEVDGFDLTYWHNDKAACGTTCCIAGALVEFNGLRPKSRSPDWYDSYFEDAVSLAEIPEACARELFYADAAAASVDMGCGNYRSKVTPAWAARCIRNLIATGCVDWEGTRDG